MVIAMQKKLRALHAHHADALLILASRPYIPKQHDTHYPYDAGADFRFLTTLNIHPCIFIRTPSEVLHVFLPAHNPKHSLWEGPRVDTLHASHLPCDHIHDIETLSTWLATHTASISTWLIDPVTLHTLLQPQKLIPPHVVLHDMTPYLESMRSIKDTYALKNIQQAVEGSIVSHATLMHHATEHASECSLEGMFIASGYLQGLRELAYMPIIASGAQATILHYSHNNAYAQEGDWLLVDAGWACEGYASDITRTYPLNKKATGIRRTAYECVLDVQRAIIADIKPGTDWDVLTLRARKLLLQHTISAGILPRTATQETLNKYFPHRLGHWLGIEVHDRNPYRTSDNTPIPWQAGMVVTIEPGLYFPADDPDIHPSLRGFGIRIEDDILVTPEGSNNLSQQLPVDLEDIAHVTH